MKSLKLNYFFAGILILLSILFFILQNLIFNQPTEAGFLLFQDLAFLPLNVLLVTFVLDSILNARKKRERLSEIKIVINAFFSEAGSDTIRAMCPFITNLKGISDSFELSSDWGEKQFKSAAMKVKNYAFTAGGSRDFSALRALLKDKKDNILMMFENPNLLEDSNFTGMLWALYHVYDELVHREDFMGLPEPDLEHLYIDIVRAYQLLAIEWLFYMRHLKEKYPYLFSLAIRKNPFKEEHSVIIFK